MTDMKLTRDQIDAIRFSQELSAVVADYLDAYCCNRTLASQAAGDLSDTEYVELYDACHDALANDAPWPGNIPAIEARAITPIVIQGIPGAYFAPGHSH
jgi:hypothetical protein